MLRQSPQLKMSDLAWTLAPALLWFAAVYSRGFIIQPHCSIHPEQCTAASLLFMDQPAVGLEVSHADGLSFTTQGLSGVLALSLPLLWNFGRWALKKTGFKATFVAIGTDLVLFAQTTLLNGFFTEVSHLLTWRPRPFVYMDPVRAGDFSNYTSFYSGHTSFSAAASVYVVLTLAGRRAPTPVLIAAAALAYALMSLTGFYRILAGRHFPSDVLVAAIAGTAVAWVVALRHRPSGPALASPDA